MKLKTKVCKKNTDKINEIMSTHNGKCSSHVFTEFAEIETLANDAESKLCELGIPKNKRQGATLVASSGELLPSAYKYSRTIGVARFHRGCADWFLVSYRTFVQYTKTAGESKLALTEGQSLVAVESWQTSGGFKLSLGGKE